MGKFYTTLVGFTVCLSLLAACVTTEPTVDADLTEDQQRKARVDSAQQVKIPVTLEKRILTKPDTTKVKVHGSTRNG
jgi:hypothetical protein